MQKWTTLALMLLMALALSACGTTTAPTNNTRNDAESAQNLQPNIAGYTTTNVDNFADALTQLGLGASAVQGNAPLVALISRAEATLQCFQDRGAIDARAYSRANLDLSNLQIPEAGLSVVINNNRLAQEAIGCITGNSNQPMMAQAVQPCVSTGQFSFRQNSYTYVYVGLGDQLCGYFEQHFGNLSANPS